MMSSLLTANKIMNDNCVAKVCMMRLSSYGLSYLQLKGSSK